MNQKKSSPLKIALLSIAVLILLFIPYIGEVLRTFNTMIHESGHAAVTSIFNGEVEEIELYANTEGVTTTRNGGFVAKFLTSISGYISTSLAIIGMVWLIKRKKYAFFYASIMLLTFINLVFWVRNLYGFVWVISLLAILGFILYKKKEWIDKALYAMLLIVTVDATRSVIDILMLSINTPKDAGDATGLASLTLIPAIVWGIFFVVQHVICLFFAIRIMIDKKEKKEKKKIKKKRK